jgi:hypothetical protein
MRFYKYIVVPRWVCFCSSTQANNYDMEAENRVKIYSMSSSGRMRAKELFLSDTRSSDPRPDVDECDGGEDVIRLPDGSREASYVRYVLENMDEQDMRRMSEYM